ncbi:MAG: fibronectin type III domain-containing protein, partial [Planctomycetia bacterium]|nr:fibronectin type III domain-containing protein [Planctomycetia bacterium]
NWYSMGTTDANTPTGTYSATLIGTRYHYRVAAINEFGSSEWTTGTFSSPVLLPMPELQTPTVSGTTVQISWEEISNAESYLLEYKLTDATEWISISTQNTTASFEGERGAAYDVRVTAVGDGEVYLNSVSTQISVEIPDVRVSINKTKITITWDDQTPATGDHVRYRAEGASRWTVKKLKAGVESLAFSGKAGLSYEIQVLEDGSENQITSTTATILAAPKIKANKADIKDDAFILDVTNYAGTNLATAAETLVVTLNGQKLTFDIENGTASGSFSSGNVGGVNVGFSAGKINFSKLASNTKYDVIVAFGQNGNFSTESKLSVKTTAAPYLVPQNVQAQSVSGTEILVMWEASKGKKSDRTAEKYTVQYLKNGRWSNATTSATGTSYTITRLASETEYKVRVFATKDRYFLASEASNEATATTGVILAQPKLKVNKADIKDDNFKAEITNYANSNLKEHATEIDVTIENVGNVKVPIQDDSETGKFSNGVEVVFNNGVLEFSNAKSLTTYSISVSLGMENNVSKASKINVKTMKAPYNTPTDVSAMAQSDTEILVTWTASTGKGSDQTAAKYTIEYSTDGGNKWSRATTGAVGGSHVINRLKAATEYKIRVSATKDNSFEQSEYSEAGALVRTFLATPKISGVTSNNIGTALISWDTVAKANNFTLEYRKYSDSNSPDSGWESVEEIANEGRKITQTLDVLESGATYEFRVLAVSLNEAQPSSLYSPIKVLKSVK